jgi:hypothetical protein
MSPAPRESRRCARNERCADREKVTEVDISQCECDCHGHGLDYPCSIEDGCGFQHKETKRWAGCQLNAEQGLCEMCETHVSQAVRHLIGDYVELTSLLGTSGAASDAQVKFSRELRIPLRLAAKTLQEAILEETSTWLPTLTEALGMDWYTSTEERIYRAQVRVHRASRILTHTVSQLLKLPPQEVPAWDSNGMPLLDETFEYQDAVELDGIDAALRLLRLHELTKVVAGRTELVHELVTPCPRCNRIALVRYDGTTEVTCRGCHDTWPEADIKRLCLVLASDERRLIAACAECDGNGLLPDRTVHKHSKKPTPVAA